MHEGSSLNENAVDSLKPSRRWDSTSQREVNQAAFDVCRYHCPVKEFFTFAIDEKHRRPVLTWRDRSYATSRRGASWLCAWSIRAIFSSTPSSRLTICCWKSSNELATR